MKKATPRGEEVHAAITQMDVLPCDVWALSLLTFRGPQYRWVTLEELFNGQHKLKAVKRRMEGDHELVFIELEHENANLQIWLDPQVNYLARKKTIASLRGLNTRAESEVVRFKEAEPGIYFPEQVETRKYYNDNLSGITTTTFADIRINEPFRPDVFKLHYPSGTMVKDTIQGKIYTVDSEGRPVREVTNLHLVQTPPLSVGAKPQTVTEFEPKSWTRWVLPASLGVLAVGIVAWLIRKRAGKRAAERPA